MRDAHREVEGRVGVESSAGLRGRVHRILPPPDNGWRSRKRASRQTIRRRVGVGDWLRGWWRRRRRWRRWRRWCCRRRARPRARRRRPDRQATGRGPAAHDHCRPAARRLRGRPPHRVRHRLLERLRRHGRRVVERADPAAGWGGGGGALQEGLLGLPVPFGHHHRGLLLRLLADPHVVGVHKIGAPGGRAAGAAARSVCLVCLHASSRGGGPTAPSAARAPGPRALATRAGLWGRGEHERRRWVRRRGWVGGRGVTPTLILHRGGGTRRALLVVRGRGLLLGRRALLLVQGCPGAGRPVHPRAGGRRAREGAAERSRGRWVG